MTIKSDLTHDEKLRAAYAYLINGVAQHHIAALYGVNQGRISEAVAMVSKAIGYPAKGAAPLKDVPDEFGMPYTPADNGIEIKTWRGVGYYLDDENKAKLKQLMEKKDD